MAEKNRVIVKILGQEYSLVSDDSREHMQRISNIVDDKMRDIQDNNKKLSTSMIAVLTALNMTDEYLKAQEKAEMIEVKYGNPDQEINKVNLELKNIRNSLTESELRCFELENTHNDLLQSVKEYEETILQLRTQINQTSSELSESGNKICTSESVILELQEEIAKLENELLDRGQELQKNENRIDGLGRELELSRLELSEFVEAFDRD